MDKASQIVYNTYFEPTKNNRFEFIGTEFEYPIFSNNNEMSLTEVGDKLLTYLIENYGYTEVIRGSNGYLVRIDKDGDSISFDYHYAMIEFSMAPTRNLCDIKTRLDAMLSVIIDFYKEYDVEMLGLGNFYPKRQKSEYTFDAFYTMIREFLANCMGKAPVDQYLCNMCSTQTHLDIPFEDLLETYNFFNELSFVRGLLLSNSPIDTPDGVCYCCRDDNWDACGVPNTGLYDAPFSTLEDFAEAISHETVFVKMDGDKLSYMKPTPLVDYFDVQNQPEENIAFFRSFKHVVVNKYHCLEVREDCTQPFDEALVPTAFNLGMALGVQEAYPLLKQFKEKANLTEGNTVLRAHAVRGTLNVDKDELKSFLYALYDIAYEKLSQRGYGEERLLEPLKSRIETNECPAMTFLKNNQH